MDRTQALKVLDLHRHNKRADMLVQASAMEQTAMLARVLMPMDKQWIAVQIKSTRTAIWKLRPRHRPATVSTGQKRIWYAEMIFR